MILTSGVLNASTDASAQTSNPYANVVTPPPAPKVPKGLRGRRHPYNMQETMPKPPNGPLDAQRVPHDGVNPVCEDCNLNRDVINVPNNS